MKMKTAMRLFLLLAACVITTMNVEAAAPTVSPATVKFDPEAADLKDLVVRLNLNESRLTGVRIGLAPLVAGRDFTVKGDRVTIRGACLAAYRSRLALIFDCDPGPSPSVNVMVREPLEEDEAPLRFSPEGGVYAGPQNVVVTRVGRAPAGEAIRYTTDGSDPTRKSRKASGESVLVDRSLTLKARTFAADGTPGLVAVADFTIEEAGASSNRPVERARDVRPGAGSYQVYVGSAYYMREMMDRSRWSYVADTADGLYHRFMGVDPLGDEGKKTLSSHFRSRRAVMEGGLRNEDHVRQDDEWIADLQAMDLAPVATFVNGLNVTEDMDPPAGLEAWWRERVTLNRTRNVLSFTMQAPHRVCRDGWASPKYEQPKRLTVLGAGTSTDAPNTLMLQLEDRYRQSVVDIIQWTHRQGRSFMFLVSPNESTTTFHTDTMKVVRFLEDHDAAPDIYGVTLYGKRPLHLTPESTVGADGVRRPLSTLTGAAYYLLKHARADGGELDLWASDVRGTAVARGVACEDATQAVTMAVAAGEEIVLHVANRDAVIDFIPSLRARVEGLPIGTQVKFRSGVRDISEAVLSRSGHCFYRSERLLPGTEQKISLRIGPLPPNATGRIVVELLPYPGSRFVRDVLVFTAAPARSP